MTAADLLAHFPPGAEPRPAQARLLEALGAALEEGDDAAGPRVFTIEAPPGVGKSHLAMTLARWSGDAYLLTSQKLLQDQYEREFGDALQLVKGRENYLCERYPPPARVTTTHGLCRRPRAPDVPVPLRAREAGRAQRPHLLHQHRVLPDPPPVAARAAPRRAACSSSTRRTTSRPSSCASSRWPSRPTR